MIFRCGVGNLGRKPVMFIRRFDKRFKEGWATNCALVSFDPGHRERNIISDSANNSCLSRDFITECPISCGFKPLCIVPWKDASGRRCKGVAKWLQILSDSYLCHSAMGGSSPPGSASYPDSTPAGKCNDRSGSQNGGESLLELHWVSGSTTSWSVKPPQAI
jgi:hypothetical protein